MGMGTVPCINNPSYITSVNTGWIEIMSEYMHVQRHVVEAYVTGVVTQTNDDVTTKPKS